MERSAMRDRSRITLTLHHRMQMIRKHHDGGDRERPLALRDAKGATQRNDVVGQGWTSGDPKA